MRTELQLLLHAIQGAVSAGMVLRIILIFQNGRNEEKSLNEICRKAERVVYAGIIAISIMSFSDWASGKLSALQGAGNMNDIGNVVIAFIKSAIAPAAMVGEGLTSWHFVKELILYQFGDDNDKPVHEKAAKKQLVIGVVIVCVAAVISVVIGYF
ncbi:MAG: hypothetical protein J6C33_02310 [Lachnospiraceae bacterium]|nr:hypothetical protein [Lachnospiraceae bacterium]